jgi:hypothetical protein
MPPNFIACGRAQEFLLPPSLLDWMAEDHLVWSILSAVEELDLSAFCADYRADGHGRPAYDPAMMVALLLYGCAGINRHGEGDESALHRRASLVFRTTTATLGAAGIGTVQIGNETKKQAFALVADNIEVRAR